MQILLLGVAGFPLKAIITHLPIDQHFASYNTHARTTICQTIQQGSLAGPGNTHQGRESTGLDPAIDVVQDAPRSAIDLDVVAHVAPMEDTSRAPKSSLVAGYILTQLSYNWYSTRE